MLAYDVICVIAEEFEQSKDVAPEAYVRASCFTKQIDEDQTRELRRRRLPLREWTASRRLPGVVGTADLTETAIGSDPGGLHG